MHIKKLLLFENKKSKVGMYLKILNIKHET